MTRADRQVWPSRRFLWIDVAWGIFALLNLVAIYVFQELLEGAVAGGHPAGLLGVFGYGGWWAIPVSLCVGLALAAVFHGARWALDEVAQRRASRPRRRPAGQRRPDSVPAPRFSALAEGWSGRGPPAAVSPC